MTYSSFFKEKHKDMKKLRKESGKLKDEIGQVRETIPLTLKKFNDQLSDFFNYAINMIKHRNYEDIDELTSKCDDLLEIANEIPLSRVKILKKIQKGVKVSMTYIEMLSETKNLLLNVIHLIKADAKFIETYKSGEKIRIQEKYD